MRLQFLGYRAAFFLQAYIIKLIWFGFFSQRVPRRSAGRLWRARHVFTRCWRSRNVHVWVGQRPQPVGGWSLWPAPVPRQRPRLLQRRLVRVSAATRSRLPINCISYARISGHDDLAVRFSKCLQLYFVCLEIRSWFSCMLFQMLKTINFPTLKTNK